MEIIIAVVILLIGVTVFVERTMRIQHRANAKVTDARNELQRINTAIQAAATTFSIQEIATLMLTMLHEILPFDYAGLELLNEDGETFTYFAPKVYVSEETKRHYAAIPPVRLSADPPDSLISIVFKEKRVVFLRETKVEDLLPYQQAHFALTPWTSLLMMPMEVMGRVIGCVVFTGKQAFDLNEERLATIERHVQQFTAAFINARQFRQLLDAQQQIQLQVTALEAQKNLVEKTALETEMVELFVRIINREKEFEPLLHVILYQIGYVVPTAEKASVMVYQPETNDFRFVQVAGYPFEEFRSVALSRQDTLHRWMTHEQKVGDGIFIVRSFLRTNFESVQAPPLCALAMTLEVDRELAGLLFLDNFSRHDAFNDDDVVRVSALREHINSAFAKALATKRLQQQRRQLQESYNYLGILSDIGRDITATLDLEAVLNTLYGHINRLMDASIFEVGLYLSHHNLIRFELVVHHGKQVESFQCSIAEHNHFAVRCIEQRSTIIINDIEGEFGDDSVALLGRDMMSRENKSSDTPRSLLCVPLITQDKIIGVIAVMSMRKNAYTQYHLDMLRSIASNAVSALANAEAYREIRRQQNILEDQAAEIELINTELSERNMMLERSEQLLEEEARNVEIANATLQEKNLQLEQLNIEKNEFLGIVAHDLKNPLASIGMSIELLQKYKIKMTAEDVEQRLDAVRVLVARMNNIVTNLLGINAIETGMMNIILESVNVSRLVEHIVGEYGERAAAKSIRLQYNYDTQSCFALADTTALQEVVENLISNAIKYSPNGKNIWIIVKEQETRSSEHGSTLKPAPCCLILVKDEGPGISGADMKKLFGKFARLSAQPTAGEHSTGLGLSIVKKLVEAMSGRVWCESEFGEGLPSGATFIVELPATH